MYKEVSLPNIQSTNNLLARLVVAKIEDEDRLVDILRSTPIVQDNPDWRCRHWLADAISRVASDGKAVGTAQLNWAKVEAVARDYVGKKVAAGRYSKAEDMALPKPTWDMLEEKEIVP